ncbi:putative geranylgeranyl diphosphate synthase [Aspergillus uvarum CBS 121591]|uniref:(2E,6E)-farnesyl diphosphate synthase n=1 Tax=Aspergillus uvarum CBS 121591 TaxID=1448315 RepID=A0A319C7J3_9EURO|nr:putative geranylgeranyl diphosphate synthase [Aspergillus uvarum CBS 121591]PYH81194.1 putative geranylgeranyl diphosphate synthase [Aspergillus uvarum CBS 121591]
MTVEAIPQPQTLGIDEHNTSSPVGNYGHSDEKLDTRIEESQPRVGSLGMQSGRPEIHGHQVSTNHVPNQEEIISGPMEYLLSSHGKSFRGKLIAGFNRLLEVPQDKLNVISRVIELLHTASLLIDDIQDRSTLRRGLPVAHSIFGVAQTINSANHAYFLAQKHLEGLGNPAALPIFTEEMLNLHRGQGMDLYWRDSLTCPTEEEYLDMVSNKTGGLFRLAIRLMQLESRKSGNYVSLINLVGTIFQIRDDYQNLKGEAYTSNKGFCEDLTEGKFSFPIIHSIRQDSANRQLLHILRQRTTNEAVKTLAVRRMEATGSFRYCRQKISMLMSEVRAIVAGLDGGGSAEVNAILDFLEFE